MTKRREDPGECRVCGCLGPKPCKRTLYCRALSEIARLKRALRVERAIERRLWSAVIARCDHICSEERPCASCADFKKDVAFLRRGARRGKR